MNRIILIGASTGGVDATLTVLRDMPADSPGIIIVQHMPDNFTELYAHNLNKKLPHIVKEATGGECVLPGHIYIGKAGNSLEVTCIRGNYILLIGGHEKRNGHCPSIDVLFESAAAAAGKNATGVLLTGMGDDGARGLLTLKKAGAHTIGQDEETSVVYGMPKAAYEIGALSIQLPLSEIAAEILRRQ